MRPLILTALLLAHAPAVSCQRPPAAGVERMVEHLKSEQAQTKRERPVAGDPIKIPPENRERYRDLLFVDQTLEEIARYQDPAAQPDNLATAHQDLRAGRPAEAKKKLRQVLSDPASEVRQKLWAWNALRALGERPPPAEGRVVRGVVLEVWVDPPEGFDKGWFDIMAVYSDGRVRYLNEHHWNGVIWEAPDDPRIGPLAAAVVKAAAPLVDESRPVERHIPARPSFFRVTVLTYNGLHVVEVDRDGADRHPAMVEVFNQGSMLLLALSEEDEARKEREKARPERD